MSAFEQGPRNGPGGLLAGGAAGGPEPRVAAVGGGAAGPGGEGPPGGAAGATGAGAGLAAEGAGPGAGGPAAGHWVDLALGAGAACGLAGRDPVLQLQTSAGPIQRLIEALIEYADLISPFCNVVRVLK